MNLPTHIGIILDGNRRFAKELLKRPWEGHKLGLVKAREVLQWSCESGIKYMTAYVLSLENLKSRPKAELRYIIKYLETEADNILNDTNHVVHRFKVKVRFIGRLQMLPARLQEKLAAAEARTIHYNRHFLNIALAYGGQQEIIDATKKILEKGLKGVIKPSDLDEKIMKEHLYTNGQPCPDVIIRSGGEKRLSNFLPFQSVYSELIFTDKRWPELTRTDFDGFLSEFDSRKRRFGG
jgi:tritrans,polycis-undecaprenyl-diphosphate synthase [geranylgeranyl-diphosphate specific]